MKVEQLMCFTGPGKHQDICDKGRPIKMRNNTEKYLEPLKTGFGDRLDMEGKGRKRLKRLIKLAFLDWVRTQFTKMGHGRLGAGR